MKKGFYVLMVVLFMLGCKNKKEYTVEGRLMLTCDVPASGKELSLYQQSVTLTSNGGFLKNFTCDENGYFKVVYRPENSGELSIRSNGILLDGIPGKKNIQVGTVYYNPPEVNFTIRLQVNNPYTSSDTLYYYDWNYPQNGASHWIRKVAGPFQSGIIDSVINAGYVDFPLTFGMSPKMKVNYYINDFQSNNQDATVELFPCSGTFSEAVLAID